MIKPEQVPEEVVKRFATWQFPKCTDTLMRSMLADALNAWPGAGRQGLWSLGGPEDCLILPLTREQRDV